MPTTPDGAHGTILAGDRDGRGFSLIEAIVATLVAIIAILGLAFSFGQGRAFINDYETARAALADAQNVLETLSTVPVSDSTLSVGTHGRPFILGGVQVGAAQWNVTPYLDPTFGTGAANYSLNQVVVTVGWNSGNLPHFVQLSRLVPAQ